MLNSKVDFKLVESKEEWRKDRREEEESEKGKKKGN